MLISDGYREQNRLLHQQRADYGASGAKHAQMVKELCQYLGTRSVLDYGCGKRILEDALDFPITNYDPAIEGCDEAPAQHDIVVCGDVLEHIEPECLDAVLDDLQRVTGKILIATVATRPAKKTLPDGRNAHLIQKPMEWWLPRLWQRFSLMNVVNAKGHEFTVVAEPRTWPFDHAAL